VQSVALFVPCYIDQLYPHVAIAALRVLERLGVQVSVPEGATCCGQPPANAGFAHATEHVLARFVRTHAGYDRVVVLSGSCAVHVRAHAGALAGAAADGTRVAARTTEFCAFLHDEVGLGAVAALGAEFPARVGLHIGCHGLRGLGLACSTEIPGPRFNKVRALLETVRGVSFSELARPDECCGFGGTFAVGEPAISAKMGRDRLRDYTAGRAEVLVSTDVSCLMHLGGLARAGGTALPMLHVAEVLGAVPGAPPAHVAPRSAAASAQVPA
jgi:L-lactate dehydrogenase complex protein LldE